VPITDTRTLRIARARRRVQDWQYRARRAINGLIRLLMRVVLLRITVEGLENVPAQGPTIVIFNHVNFLDGPLALGLIPRDMVGMTKIETFDTPILGTLARWYGIFGVRRGEVDRQALRQAHEILAEGKALLYSPEGHRSGTGNLQEAKDGIALIAMRANAAIVPMAFVGLERFKENAKRLRHTEIRVIIGEPFRLKALPHVGRREMLRLMTTQVMYRLAALLPAEYRGEYHDLRQASLTHLDFLGQEANLS